MTNQIFQNHTVIRVLESEDLHVRQVKSAPKYAAEQKNMNRISIDHLTEAELIDLNHRIVQRLRLISQVHAHKAMLEFRIGDRVTFEPQGGNPLFGILTRYNKKSVTVVTDDGRWNVSPSFLRRAELGHETATGQEDAHPSAVIPFRQK
jgi:hypothetical protein